MTIFFGKDLRLANMIPNSIKVAGMTYKVEEVPFVEIDGDRNFQGVCLYHESTIRILETLSEARKEQTFVHELTHAIFYEAGFEDQDEDMINRVSLVLHQVLKDLQR
jgi:Zn-dependent peptidase ImmA (M78 family)